MLSIKDCLASPSAAKESKVLLRKVEIELKRLIGSLMGARQIEGRGVGFARVEEEGFLTDFYTSNPDRAGISLSGTVTLAERISLTVLKSPKLTSSSSPSSSSAP